MKAALLALGAVAFASAAAAEQPRHVRSWIAEAKQEITQGVAADAAAGANVLVRFKVSDAGRPQTPQVIRGSGLTAVDAAVLDAVRRARTDRPPTELLGRRITVLVPVAATPVRTAAAAINVETKE